MSMKTQDNSSSSEKHDYFAEIINKTIAVGLSGKTKDGKEQAQNIADLVQQLRTDNAHLGTELNNMKIAKTRLEVINKQYQRSNLLTFFLSLISLLLVGFGTNVVTGKDYPPGTGWMMIVVGVAINIIDYFIKPGERNEQ